MRKKGFTLVELLVVIAIIGLLSTLAVVALNSARQKSRDAKRVADIKQIQTALELFFNDQNGYPVAAAGGTLGVGGFGCLGTSGWAATGCGGPYMSLVPTNTTPSGSSYIYTAATNASYTITFNLEAATGGLGSGNKTASPGGITD